MELRISSTKYICSWPGWVIVPVLARSSWNCSDRRDNDRLCIWEAIRRFAFCKSCVGFTPRVSNLGLAPNTGPRVIFLLASTSGLRPLSSTNGFALVLSVGSLPTGTSLKFGVVGPIDPPVERPPPHPFKRIATVPAATTPHKILQCMPLTPVNWVTESALQSGQFLVRFHVTLSPSLTQSLVWKVG